MHTKFKCNICGMVYHTFDPKDKKYLVCRCRCGARAYNLNNKEFKTSKHDWTLYKINDKNKP